VYQCKDLFDHREWLGQKRWQRRGVRAGLDWLEAQSGQPRQPSPRVTLTDSHDPHQLIDSTHRLCSYIRFCR
jgi:hypothetical protein